MIVFKFTDSYYKDFTDMYVDLVYCLMEEYDHEISPRGLKIKEILNATIVVNPEDCKINFKKTSALERQEVYDKYCKQEHEWYLSGNTLASSAPSKFWNQLAGEDGHITSNYGHMMLFDPVYPTAKPVEAYGVSINDGTFASSATLYTEEGQTAIDRVVATLTKDPDSRQAVVHYNQPRHCYPENKDFPCTMYSQFFIRNNTLSMTTYQRSCDIIKGFSYDVPWNCSFMKMVHEKLSQSMLELKLGAFTHSIGSLHLYEKDAELASKIIASSPSDR